MANPKKKMSRCRTHRRRSLWKLEPPTLIRCPQCHSWTLPHRVCPSCGYYDGEEIITVKEEK